MLSGWCLLCFPLGVTSSSLVISPLSSHGPLGGTCLPSLSATYSRFMSPLIQFQLILSVCLTLTMHNSCFSRHRLTFVYLILPGFLFPSLYLVFSMILSCLMCICLSLMCICLTYIFSYASDLQYKNATVELTKSWGRPIGKPVIQRLSPWSCRSHASNMISVWL